MNDINSKMIYDGYKSLSDKVDNLEFMAKRLHSYINDHRSAIIELDNKVDSLLFDNEIEGCYCEDDEEDIRDAMRYSDINTLILLVRNIMNEERMTLHDVIKRLISDV
jgi:hypothetical protein